MNTEKLYITVKTLVKDATALKKALKIYDSDLEAEDSPSLATLAADAGTLAYQFNSLRVDIIKQHEKKQIDV